MTRTALKTARSLLGVVLVSLLVPATLSAQASGTMKASVTVVSSHSVAPQVSAADLTETAVEQMQFGEQVELGQMDDSGVTVSMDVAEHLDPTAPVTEREADGQRVLHVTVAYAGN